MSDETVRQRAEAAAEAPGCGWPLLSLTHPWMGSCTILPSPSDAYSSSSKSACMATASREDGRSAAQRGGEVAKPAGWALAAMGRPSAARFKKTLGPRLTRRDESE